MITRNSEDDLIYAEMALKRPLRPLLPNLSTLKLVSKEGASSLSIHLLFASPSVTELLLSLPERTPKPDRVLRYISIYFEEIVDRMPNVEVLSIASLVGHPRWKIWQLQENLTNLFTGLKNLRSIHLPLGALEASILNCLSDLPNITVVGMGDGLGQVDTLYDDDDDDDGGFSDAELAPGSFAALTTLEFVASFTEAANLLKVDFARGMESLYVHSQESEKARAMKDIFAVLSKCRGNLKELHLDSVHQQHEAMRQNGSEVDRVTARTLAPLRTLCGLRKLHLSYHRAFEVDDDDFMDLVSIWPDLEMLRFCSDPVLNEQPKLTAFVLPKLTKATPKLTHLSLFLDTRVGFSSLDVRNENSHLFGSLREISFGTSPLRKEDTLNFTLYLAKFLPRTCSTYKLREVYWTVGRSFASRLPSNSPQAAYRTEWERMSYALEVQIASLERERTMAHHLQN